MLQYFFEILRYRYCRVRYRYSTNTMTGPGTGTVRHINVLFVAFCIELFQFFSFLEIRSCMCEVFCSVEIRKYFITTTVRYRY